VWRLRALLNPLRYGRLSFQYVSHRVLRWTVTPVCLLLLLPVNVWLLLYPAAVGCAWLYVAALVMQLLFYLTALMGYTAHRRGKRKKFLFIPYYFLFMNMSVFKAVVYLYKRRGKKDGTWEKARR
jgi:hypothetical protein